MDEEKVRLLIEIILDPKAEDHEKSDAAMELSEYTSEDALEALIFSSKNPSKEDIAALEEYGQTIGIYWVNRNRFPLDDYLSLNGTVRSAICEVLESRKPEWVEKYQLYQYGFQD